MKTLYIENSDRLFFTSDLHFGHERIIEYCNRPYSSVHEMNKSLTDNWNSRITNDDTIIIAGDFCLGGKQQWEKYLSYLNGNKILVLGNHDHKVPEHLFKVVTPLLNMEVRDVDNGKLQRITVCHYAMLSWHQSHKGAWQLFGHWHGRSLLNPKRDDISGFIEEEQQQITKVNISRQYDVGIDNNDYYPISYLEIKQIFKNEDIRRGTS